MALRSDWSTLACPIARGLDVLGDPWVMLVLREVLSGVHRYDELRSALGAADNVLSDRLRRMVDEGLLVRVPYSSGNRPRMEYHATQAGADALPVLHALMQWGNRHTTAPNGPMRILHRDCGTEAHSADRCDTCGVALTTANVAWGKPSQPGRLVELESARD
ncbi:MAG: helix-turn-helix transcriptional regulator [Propionibacteriales bacterium]|nr:helix-turn-helix transcriptional regulator [Propionibacteriales bacterium]